MLSSMVIVFREMLEMTLVVGILLAATKGVPFSRRWIGGGVGIGLAGALFFGIFMEELESSFNGDGEIFFNVLILTSASMLIAWTLYWMRSHGAEISRQMKDVAQSVNQGDLPGMVLAAVTLSAVMREGSEAVFFLFGASQSVALDGWSMVLGGVSGALLALMVGVVVYFGLMRVPLDKLFAVAGWLLMLIAAGMASQAAGLLVMVDWLPAIIEPLWNSSALLSVDSMPGELLHVLIGYEDKPSAMQVIVYMLVLICMWGMMHRMSYSQKDHVKGAIEA